MRQPYQSPHILPFSIFVQHPGHRFFAVKHQQQVVLLAVNLLCSVLRFLLLAGADGLPCFIQLHRVEALDLLPKPGILIQGSVQLGGMHQLTGDFYTVGEVLGHTLAGIGVSLGLSMNFEAVTARYVDVRLERKKEVLDAYHGAVKQADPAKAKEAEPKKARNAEKKKSNEIEL